MRILVTSIILVWFAFAWFCIGWFLYDLAEIVTVLRSLR